MSNNEKEKHNLTETNKDDANIREEQAGSKSGFDVGQVIVEHLDKLPDDEKQDDAKQIEEMPAVSKDSDNLVNRIIDEEVDKLTKSKEETESKPVQSKGDIDEILKEHVDKLPGDDEPIEDKDLDEKDMSQLLVDQFDQATPNRDEAPEGSDGTKSKAMVIETQPQTESMAEKAKTSDEQLDQIIDEEMAKMKTKDKSTEKTDKKEEEGEEKEKSAGQDEKEGGKPQEETDKTVQGGEKPKEASTGTYPEGYCIQDDVRFLKFIASLNDQVCTCNTAGNDFVVEDCGSYLHKTGCPSCLSPRDVESVKILFLTRHKPVCKRFLTVNERQVLKNILKTAPYYQMEFFTQHTPYEVKCDGMDLIKSHMLDERTFPKR
ncbi:hypothetical protein M8J76_008023 [Diaphorina citri]|nr:hypothetical protein M8J76_008023 [Diaphorina citri]